MYREKIQGTTVETCRHRIDPRREGDAEFATCALVEEVTGLAGEPIGGVPRAACEACCRSFPPSAREINPVVASLVLATALRVIDRGGVPGCDLDRAEGLRESAIDLLDDLWADDLLPASDPATAAPVPLDRLIPPPGPPRGPSVRRWAVGVITAPRRRATLERCLDSITRAGWDDPFLFIDGVNVPPRYAHLQGTYRDSPIGAWSNYYLALSELLMRRPDADAIMVVEDDALFYDQENMRSYLERMLWPGETPGLLSLYCSSVYTRPKAGWGIYNDRWTWGALAFVFPRDLARRFLIDPEVFDHRWKPDGSGMFCIDIMIGLWALRCQVPIWYPTPSLVQHIGDTSAIWSRGSRADGTRRADRFAGDASREDRSIEGRDRA